MFSLKKSTTLDIYAYSTTRARCDAHMALNRQWWNDGIQRSNTGLSTYALWSQLSQYFYRAMRLKYNS